MFKKTLSVVLSLTMLVLLFVPAIAQIDNNQDMQPTIVIPGIGQSRIVYANNESGSLQYAFPMEIDASALLKSTLLSSIPSLVSAKDGFVKTLAKGLASDIIEPFKIDNSGSFVNDIEVESYPNPYSQLSEEEKKYINSNIPVERIIEQTNVDYVYYFAYNFFAAPYYNAELLDEFIEVVKTQSGQEKVNIIAGSQGATILTAYLDEYGSGSISKVVYIVPAIQGSSSAADILLGKFDYSDKILYDKLFSAIIDDGLSDVLSVLFRLVPKQIVIELFESVINALILESLSNSAGFISLVPPEFYQEVANKHLSSDESTQLKEQTDKYYAAQSNVKTILSNAMLNGVQIFNIVGYDSELFPIFENAKTNDSDQIIDVKYASLGATVADIGETLPLDYVQKNTYCSCQNNHISPDNRIDASTGFLCETTWFFKGQVHGVISRNDVIISLVAKLLFEDSISNVFSDTGFPQFNEARNGNSMRSLIAQAKEIDIQLLSENDAQELQMAIEECELLLENTVVNSQEFSAAQDRLESILIELGERQENSISRMIRTIYYIFSVIKNIFNSLGG